MLELNAKVDGSGPDLIILHGLFGSAGNFGSFARELAEDFRVHRLDLRNHGESPHDPSMDYPSMVNDVVHYLDRHCGGRAHVAGHSMGGKVAMGLALTCSERVHRLMVLDIAPVQYEHSFRRFTKAMRAVPLDQLQDRGDADSFLQQASEEPGVRAFLLQNLRRGQDGWRWRINLPVIADALATLADFPYLDAAAFEGPALFLHGEESEYVDQAGREAIARLFPSARLQSIEEAGHWLHADRPQQTLRAMHEFLR